MSKTIRLSESDINRIVSKVLTEQTTLLSLPSANILFGSGKTPKEILLKGINPKTNTSLVLRYEISGSYGFVGFDVNLRNVSRDKNTGVLFAEAQPNSKIVSVAMKKLIPSQSLTTDGWLKVEIPKSEIDKAISTLRTNRGVSAEIEVKDPKTKKETGITIKLKLVTK